MEAVKKFERAQTCFLDHVFSMAVVSREPAGVVVRGVEMGNYDLLKIAMAALIFHWWLLNER
jgi:hypothetical protein